ncbi:hypothetical protein ABZ297_37000 [Nonomuraea sp. NPDC005983]|uniref:hypothetical protein n=1 Tax=Nonomuraea sp. NPDC005983 TaxID=3155595 RepID=UPI0033AAF914
MDLDEAAVRLYALPPSEFTTARAAEARAAKDGGDAALAREIAGLRKPTVSAWAVNRAARDHPDVLRELLDLGEQLRAAWQRQDPDALAELTRRRGAVSAKVSRLIRQSARLSPAAATEVDQTLDAAIVDADAAERVRRGLLDRALNYTGFAPAPILRDRPARKKVSAEDKAAEARRREEAGRQEEARRAKERRAAEAAHQEWQQALQEAVQQHDRRAERVAELERKLSEARKKLEESRQRLDVTRREERHARQRLEG